MRQFVTDHVSLVHFKNVSSLWSILFSVNFSLTWDSLRPWSFLKWATHAGSLPMIFQDLLKELSSKSRRVSCFESCTLLKWALATWPPHSKSELKWVIIIYRVVTFCLLFKCNMWKQGNGLLLDSLPDVEGGTVEVPSSADQARHSCQIWNLSKIVDPAMFFLCSFQIWTNLLCWTKSCTSSDKLFTIFNTSSAGWNWMMLRIS